MDRSDIVKLYQAWMEERWHKKRLNLEDIQALKIFCETAHLTVDEHEQVARSIGVEKRQLTDANNQPFTDWLGRRRQELPGGAGSLLYAPSPRTAIWKKRLPSPPAASHNVLAIMAAGGFVIFIAIILVIL